MSAIRAAMMKGKHGKKLALSSKSPRGPKKGGGPRVIATAGGKKGGYVDKNTGKRYDTLSDAKNAGVKNAMKRKQDQIKKDRTTAKKSDIRSTLKISNRLVKGKYRKGVTEKLADGSVLSMQGLTPQQVSAIKKQTAKEVRIAAQNKDKGKATWRMSGGGVDRSEDLRLTGTNIAEGDLPIERHYHTAAERARGFDIENIPIPKRRTRTGQWNAAKFKTVDYQIVRLDKLDIQRGEYMGRKLSLQEKKQGYFKIYASAAAGAAGIGFIGSAYAEPGPAARPGDPMAGIVAIGGNFFQGVRNTASDWTFGATERGGVPSLDVETKSQFGKVTEGAMEQAGNFVFNRPLFDEHSAAGTLPLDQAWGKAGSFAAENPAMFAGEVLGEAAFWAGTMGVGRAVWGVGRGVKLAKLATGPHTTATKAQASQYATIGQGAKAGLKEAGAITKKDPFGIWTMGYGGIGKSGKLSGKTKHSVGVVPGFESLGQTNVGKMRRSAGKRYGKGYVKREKSKASPHGQIYGTKSWKAWEAGPQLALPGSNAVKSLTKKGKLTKRSEYLAHVRKIRKTKRQKKEDKIMDNAATEWERAYYSSPY